VMVAHAEEFWYTAFDNQLDASLIPAVVSATRQSGAYVTPTLSTFEAIVDQWGRPEKVSEYLANPRAAFVSPSVRMGWQYSDYINRQGDLHPALDFLRTFTHALQAAGVPLLTGTDSPAIPGMFPGHSIHDELRNLTQAGLTPFQALSAATQTPGEFIEKTVPRVQRFGQVRAGFRADAVLVSGNPLASLELLRAPLGVMYGGRWMTADALEHLRKGLKTRYQTLLTQP